MSRKKDSTVQKTGGRLLLIDGSSFCYRAFYAIRELATSKGQPTNAIYGVVTMLRKLLEDEHPQYCGVAFDVGKPTFRHQVFEEYKIHRPPMPELLVGQIPWIKQVLSAYRIPVFEKEGFEADDLLATLTRQATEAGVEVFLVTSDKDALQLLGPKVQVIKPTRQENERVDEQTLYERWGLKPSQVVDVMSLMGDESDGIPGVPGIGEKTAVDLIQKFGSVEKLLANLEKVSSPAQRVKLKENVARVKFNQQLVTLEPHVPVEVDWRELKCQPPDREALQRLFTELEFRLLLKELLACASASAIEIQTIDSPAASRKLASGLQKGGKVAVSLALSSPRPMEAELLAVALSFSEGKAEMLRGQEGSQNFLGRILENPHLTKIVPNLKDALVVFRRLKIAAKGPWFDPCLASYLIDPSRPSHQVADLGLEFLGDNLQHPDPLEAAARQAEGALRLYPKLQEEIEQRNLTSLLEEVELPLSEALCEMEFHGIGIDAEELQELSKEMDRMERRLRDEIAALAGEEFNLNSPKQLSSILFEKLKLPVIKRGKTGPSTDEEVLRRLAPLHELPTKLLEYREISKLSSTYVEALPNLVNPATGRIHTSFNQTVTATGRLSSSNPNLQNIPIRTELGRRIRKAFVPSSSGQLFLAADYSQIELRILAHLSEDPALTEAFREGQDIHRITAGEIFHVTPQQVGLKERSVAKTINFGIVYGMSAFGLAKELQVPQDQAQEFIDRYFRRYRGVAQYLERSLEEARRKGYSTTLFHRRRYIPELRAKDLSVRSFAERTAVNTPIQGSAADLIKVAMVALARQIAQRNLSSRMLLTVHDELVLEAPEEELKGLQRLVKEVMEAPTLSGSPITLRVPIEVNLKVGRNWLEASHA